MRICIRVVLSLLIDDHRKNFHGHGEQNGLSSRSLVGFPRGNGRRVLAFTAVVVLRFARQSWSFSPVARIVPTVRVAISLALRGKARRMPYTDGWRTCVRRLLAVGMKHGNNL